MATEKHALSNSTVVNHSINSNIEHFFRNYFQSVMNRRDPEPVGSVINWPPDPDPDPDPQHCKIG